METKKEKVLKIFKRIGIGLSIGFNVLFLIAIIIGSSGAKKQNNNVNVALADYNNIVEKADFKYENKKLVSYIDNDHQIVFTADELNNYVFTNLANLLNVQSGVYNIMDFYYNQNTYVFDEFIPNEYVSFVKDYVGHIYFNFYTDRYGVFEWFDTNSSEPSPFVSGDIFFTVDDSSLYESVKSAIELDISANSGGINNGIFTTLTDSVVAFVGSLSSGITAMTSVFYDSTNSQLTTIGLLSVIVVAISLSYFLFRLLIGLIRMRG